jgi:peptidoglycan L-alanyl-D-glutamate endopeptidase CwlK
MTVSLNTLIEKSVKAMGAVDPHIHDLALKLVEKAYKEGIYVQIISGYRSFAEQDKLYAQGRTAPGNIVTNAKAGQSVHNYGLAVDFLILHPDGSANWKVDEQWKRVGAIGKSLGFDWGGDWKSFKDWGHLEYTQGHDWKDLKAGWRPQFIEQMAKVKPKPKPKPAKDDGLLKRGDKGPAVKELQQKLIKAGEKLPRYGADGDFGAETEEAVKAFQARHGLVVDGIVGSKTKAKLDEVLSKQKNNSKASVPYPGHLIKRGSRGKDVERIQRAVGVKVDGIYGPKTEAAVKEYQKRHGLAVDGIVGPKTWAVMF